MTLALPLVVLSAGLLIAIIGCTKADQEYRSGMHYLEKDGNWQMAARAFRRSVDANPNKWKSHAALLDALSRGAPPAEFEAQLKQTLSTFPDSARSQTIAASATTILGYERFSQLAGAYEMKNIGALLAKGDNPKVLSRAVMAASRARDSVAVRDWFGRLLTAGNGQPPDSVIQELNFFLGAAQVSLLKLDWRIEKNPADSEARLEQLRLCAIVGDSATMQRRIRELFAVQTEDGIRNDIAQQFGASFGLDPFGSKPIVNGWDGALSPDGTRLVYVKDLGRRGEPDPYLFLANADGSGERPILKAFQQYISGLAWPKFSPDGAWVYFYGSDQKGWSLGDKGRFQLYRVSPNYGASPKKLTNDDLLAVEPFFEKNGAVLLVRRDVGSVRQSVEIIRVSPDGKSVSQVSRIGEPTFSAAFAPTGDSLLFVTDRGLFRRSLTGGAITVDLPWKGFAYMQLSPDGKRLTLINRRGHLVIVERDTQQVYFLGATASPPVSFHNTNLFISRYIGGQRQVCRLNLAPKGNLGEQLQALITRGQQ